MDIRLIAEMIFRNEISMGYRRYLVVTALLVGAGAHAGPKDLPMLTPPMAVPQSLAIFRGRSVEISLRAQGRTPGQLKFLIRSIPSKGHLGEIRIVGPKAAEITYTHDEASEGNDSFTFAVQAIDSPVSASAPIAITILEEPPALSVVHSVNFGTLQLGVTREEQITLRNSGGGILEGRMDVPPPWKILGSPEYRLARNQEIKVRIVCSPDEQQDYSGLLRFSHDARTSVELMAKAISPFQFDPAGEIELSSQDNGTLRSGAVMIRNQTVRDRIVEVSAPPEIASPDQVIVPANSEKRIALHTQPDFLGALEGDITFESEGFQHSMPVRVFALRPLLRVEPREGLDFGEIEPRRRYKGYLRIKNEGGSAARLQVRISKEVLLVPDPNSAILQPGELRTFEVVFEVSSPGDQRSEILITAEGGSAVSIPVIGRSASERVNAKKMPTASLTPGPNSPATLQRQPDGSLSSIPSVKEIKVTASNRRFEISWRKPAPNVAAWIIQYRQLEPSKASAPKIVWRDLNNVRFFEENESVRARIENLAPNQVWFLRVLSIDGQGLRSGPSPTFTISSAPPTNRTPFWAVLFLVGVGAAVFTFLKARERRKAEATQEADQIARIEGG